MPEGAAGDAVIEAVRALADRLTFAPWNSEAEVYGGPLISARAADGALKAVDALIASGARAIRPFGRIDGLSDAFVTPGILDMAEARDIPDEEIFAPVLQVYRAADFDAAIARANDTRYGLSAGLVSDDPANWDRFQRRIRAGVVNFNRPTTGAAGDMPFGGLGASGNHRPSAYYAADYCAYPIASFEADAVSDITSEIKGLKA